MGSISTRDQQQRARIHTFSQSPLSRASRSPTGPILKGKKGSTILIAGTALRGARVLGILIRCSV